MDNSFSWQIAKKVTCVEVQLLEYSGLVDASSDVEHAIFLFADGKKKMC
jgi:hypothetical protein